MFDSLAIQFVVLCLIQEAGDQKTMAGANKKFMDLVVSTSGV